MCISHVLSTNQSEDGFERARRQDKEMRTVKRVVVNKSTTHRIFTIMKHLIVSVMIAAMVVVATEVRANNITQITSLLPINLIAAVHTDSNNFIDTFTFNGSGSYLVPGSTVALLGNIGLTTQTNINFTSVTLNGYALTLSPGGVFEYAYNYSPFSFNGSLILEVRGTTGATSLINSSYAGALISKPVPEPASLILLGAGLAGIGIWRRKSAKS